MTADARVRSPGATLYFVPAPDVAPARVSADAPDGELARDAPAAGSGPAHMAQASPHVAPTLWRGLLILVVYAAIAQGGELLSGFDSADLKASAANALTGLVLPVALCILAVLLIGGRWGWRDVFTERPDLRIHKPRSLRLALSLFARRLAGLVAARGLEKSADQGSDERSGAFTSRGHV